MKFTLDRIKKEFLIPTNKYFRNFLHIIYFFKNITFKPHEKDKESILIWDVRCNSITFDFILIIFYVVNCLKIKKKIVFFDLIIYQPRGFKISPFKGQDYNKYVSSQEMNDRIKRMILPLAKSFNCIKKITILDDQEKLIRTMNNYNTIFPRNYHPK